ncbi:MAG: fumarylacetoacetate hydrolase family protein, partial [Giesbergeria sp.]
ATKTDWEVELGIVIGTRAQRVSEDQALQHVAGYVLANDVSERAWQMERGGQWDKGKGHDSFAPIGPWLVTTDELPDPHAIRLWLEVNGQRMQDGHTSQFIFGVPQVLAYISQFMRLEPGDIVLTGTPAGVGLGRKPQPVFLKPGDVVRLGGTGLGEQCQTCVQV